MCLLLTSILNEYSALLALYILRGALMKNETPSISSSIWTWGTYSVLFDDNGYHIYQPLRSGRIWHKFNFQAEFNWFEFRVFLLLD